jgi:hypothetical protein
MPEVADGGFRFAFVSVRQTVAATLEDLEQIDCSRLVGVAQDVFHVLQRIMRKASAKAPDIHHFKKAVSRVLARGSCRSFPEITADHPDELQVLRSAPQCSAEAQAPQCSAEAQALQQDLLALINDFHYQKSGAAYKHQLLDMLNVVAAQLKVDAGDDVGMDVAAGGAGSDQEVGEAENCLPHNSGDVERQRGSGRGSDSSDTESAGSGSEGSGSRDSPGSSASISCDDDASSTSSDDAASIAASSSSGSGSEGSCQERRGSKARGNGAGRGRGAGKGSSAGGGGARTRSAPRNTCQGDSARGAGRCQLQPVADIGCSTDCGAPPSEEECPLFTFRSTLAAANEYCSVQADEVRKSSLLE